MKTINSLLVGPNHIYSRLFFAAGILTVLVFFSNMGNCADITEILYVNGATGSDSNTCLSSALPCETINGALNKSYGGDTIQIAAGTYTESLTINKDITLEGEKRSSVILDGGGNTRVIVINFGYTVALNHLTVANGVTSGTGACIYNTSTLSMEDVEITNCEAESGSGLFTTGRLSFTNGLIHNNRTTASHGAGFMNHNTTDTALGSIELINVAIFNNYSEYYGAGIHNQGSAPMRLVNVTISGNTSKNSAAAFFGTNISDTTFTNVTIADNATENDGSNITNYGTVKFLNTIIADNTGGNCYNNSSATWTSYGHNLDSGTSCGFTGELENTDPHLKPLGNYGGNTMTHALQPESPAIDAATAVEAPIVDQRGEARPYDGDNDLTPKHDIGAFEFTARDLPSPFILYLPAITSSKK